MSEPISEIISELKEQRERLKVRFAKRRFTYYELSFNEQRSDYGKNMLKQYHTLVSAFEFVSSAIVKLEKIEDHGKKSEHRR